MGRLKGRRCSHSALDRGYTTISSSMPIELSLRTAMSAPQRKRRTQAPRTERRATRSDSGDAKSGVFSEDLSYRQADFKGRQVFCKVVVCRSFARHLFPRVL